MRLFPFPSRAELLDPLDRIPSLTNSDSDNTSNSTDLSFSLPIPSVLPLNPLLKVTPGFRQQSVHSTSTTGSISPTPIYRPKYWPAPPDHVNLIRAIKYPAVLSSLLDHLAWRDFLAVACTCKESMGLLGIPGLKDIVLARFIPSYKYARSLWDPDCRWYKEVDVTYHDITQFLTSHQLPLRHYLDCARFVLLNPNTNEEQDSICNRLVDYALAHSRFVLLLQSLVHSSTSPIYPEPTEARSQSRLSQPSLRELTFPSPLAYSPHPSEKPTPVNDDQPTRSSHKRASSAYTPSTCIRPRTTSTSQTLTKGVRRRVSVFGSASVILPPPPASEPRALRVYSGTWRRTSQSISFASDDDDLFRSLPRRNRVFSSSRVSSDSSLSFRFRSPSFWNIGNASPVRRAQSSTPHALHMATSRSRAPILRVFVPCFNLTQDVIAECQSQLDEAGLWGHLSDGDLICNLGYVPAPSFEEDPFLNYMFEIGEQDHQHRQERWTWLVYNNGNLIPFSPPDPPPLEKPLALPSPWYYTHILPLDTNPRFTFRVPSCYSSPQLDLAHTLTKVASPHSLTGYALLRRWVWMAKVNRYRREDDFSTGWMGEWIMEGNGTREGQHELRECLRGKGEIKEWELVRDKSGEGRVWLRLVNPCRPPDFIHASILHLRNVD